MSRIRGKLGAWLPEELNKDAVKKWSRRLVVLGWTRTRAGLRVWLYGPNLMTGPTRGPQCEFCDEHFATEQERDEHEWFCIFQ